MVGSSYDVMSGQADKTEIYAQLCLTLRYQPEDKKANAQAGPLESMYVRTCPRGDSSATYMGDVTAELLVGADL